jgi:hypothetical protein
MFPNKLEQQHAKRKKNNNEVDEKNITSASNR